MAETATSPRVEPILETVPAAPPSSDPSSALREVVEPSRPVLVEPAPTPPVAPPLPTPAAASLTERSDLDPLARIEEKAARIEEKYARSEALMLRMSEKVDAATGRMGEVARQADLAVVRKEVSALGHRVRGLPGRTALVSVAIVTALLTSAITLALIKYLPPGILPR